MLIILYCISCGIPKADYEALKSQNEKLQQQIDTLNERIGELDYLSAYSQVVLPNTELKEIKATSNGQLYKIKIQLPRDYYQTSSEYPVLYITDAETNFGGVGYIVQRLMKDKLIPPIIVVGIAYGTDYRNFYRLRSRDLTPEKDGRNKVGGRVDPTGGAPAFCKFLSEELFPFIENNYRVDNNNRTLYGHSYGGLFCAYVLLNQSEFFNKYLILSPSLWFKDNLMLNKVKNFSKSFKSTRVYMASGELEGRIDDLQTEFANILNDKKLEGLNLEAEIFPNETHRTIFGPGFTNGMRYLFSKN